MKTIKQVNIASFIEMSPQMVCELKKGRRFLSKKKAKELSGSTGIPFETLALTNGEKLYEAIIFAYRQHRETA